MKQFSLAILALISGLWGAGCASNGPAYGEDVTAQIKALPAEQRYQLIKTAGGMSKAMKEKAIDELTASDEQKAKWKAELN